MSTPTLTVPTQSTPRAEDAANESGAAIDTFSGYVPQALPLELIEKWAHSKPNSYSSQQKSQDVVVSTSKQEPEVIEILDESSRDESVAAITERGVAKDGSSTTPTLTFSDLGLPSHSSPACESALLASISPPKPSSESVEMIADAALSPLQFEGVCCAIQRHQRILLLQGKWKRAGFFLGDAAGIGKGRQMAAVIKDSFCRGRPRHLWISVSRDLARDAKRDLDAIGCVGVPVLEAEDIFSSKSSKGLGSNNTNSRGVLFVTYSLLVSGKRMEQIIQWLITGGVSALHSVEQEQSFDGCVMLDEAHKAKNLDADTTTAKLVIALQDRLPMARVLYASATGVSSLQHMAYLTRLGLIGSSVYPDFATFQKTLSNRGMGSLELLALELKQMGAFVARSLSWEGAEFHTREIALSPEQRDQYNDAVSWWNFAKKELDYALQTVGPGGSNGMLWRIFWSAHQRFFREVAICAKIDFVVATAKVSAVARAGCLLSFMSSQLIQLSI